MTIAYKVLYESEDGRLLSGGLPFSECTIEYVQDSVVYPKIPHSKLFVFSSLDEARKWISLENYDNRCIFKCEALNVTTPLSMCNPLNDFSGNLIKFWKNRSHVLSDPILSYPFCTAPPKGTLLCDSLKLLELVK